MYSTQMSDTPTYLMPHHNAEKLTAFSQHGNSIKKKEKKRNRDRVRKDKERGDRKKGGRDRKSGNRKKVRLNVMSEWFSILLHHHHGKKNMKPAFLFTSYTVDIRTYLLLQEDDNNDTETSINII